jgi:hypothetical protein
VLNVPLLRPEGSLSSAASLAAVWLVSLPAAKGGGDGAGLPWTAACMYCA